MSMWSDIYSCFLTGLLKYDDLYEKKKKLAIKLPVSRVCVWKLLELEKKCPKDKSASS